MSGIESVRRLAEAGMARTVQGGPGLDPARLDRGQTTRKLEGARIEAGNGTSFQDQLKSMLAEVNEIQMQAGAKAEALARGEITDLHEVMLAQEEAGVAFKMVLEMRNRIVAAYQEIMRMPI